MAPSKTEQLSVVSSPAVPRVVGTWAVW